jgi:PAS domain S-box-containing protein
MDEFSDVKISITTKEPYKKQNRQLRSLIGTENQFRLTDCDNQIRNLPVPYLILTSTGLIQEINDLAVKLLGVQQTKAVNCHFQKFIQPELKKKWEEQIRILKSKNEPATFEIMLINHIGNVIDVKVDCQYDALHKQNMFVVLTDITKQKQKDAEVGVKCAAFETSDAIVITDEYRSILLVNEAFSLMTGYDLKEAIDQTPEFLRSGIHKNDFYDDMWDSATAEGFWQGEHWEKNKKGSIYPVWLSLTAVKDPSDKIMYFVRVSRDISVQKATEQLLHETKQQLETQAVNTKIELDIAKSETEQINAALTILLTNCQKDKDKARLALLCEVEETITPFINKLKGASSGRRQSSRLIGVLESNLQQLIESYGLNEDLPSVYRKLTPVEKQVATMIRQGHSTKVISATLYCSSGTICIHRKNIRKKLGLTNKTCNLQSYLRSLSE